MNEENVKVTPAQLLNDLWKSMKPAYNQYVQAGGQQDMQMLLNDWAAGLNDVGIKVDNKTRLAALLALLPVIYADGTDPQDMASCLMFALSSPKMKPQPVDDDPRYQDASQPVQQNNPQYQQYPTQPVQPQYPQQYPMKQGQQYPMGQNGQMYDQPQQYTTQQNQYPPQNGLPQPQWQ